MIMERQEKQAILLLILVICAVSATHVALSMIGTEPFAAPYTADISEGRLVLLEGLVEKATTTQEGGHLILQVQGVQVFVPDLRISPWHEDLLPPDPAIRDPEKS
jgi:hypothetical protein